MLMTVILLNFLIAVIGGSYVKLTGTKIQYQYRDKAEMNLECYELLKLIYPE